VSLGLTVTERGNDTNKERKKNGPIVNLAIYYAPRKKDIVLIYFQIFERKGESNGAIGISWSCTRRVICDKHNFFSCLPNFKPLQKKNNYHAQY